MFIDRSPFHCFRGRLLGQRTRSITLARCRASTAMDNVNKSPLQLSTLLESWINNTFLLISPSIIRLEHLPLASKILISIIQIFSILISNHPFRSLILKPRRTSILPLHAINRYFDSSSKAVANFSSNDSIRECEFICLYILLPWKRLPLRIYRSRLTFRLSVFLAFGRLLVASISFAFRVSSTNGAHSVTLYCSFEIFSRFVVHCNSPRTKTPECTLTISRAIRWNIWSMSRAGVFRRRTNVVSFSSNKHRVDRRQHGAGSSLCSSPRPIHRFG